MEARQHLLSLIIAVMMLPAGEVAAQTLPWSSTPQQQAAPTPGPSGVPAATPVRAPSMSAMGTPQATPSGGGGMPPCMAEFAKLRDDVQKRGLAAKAASARKATREEMCKHITSYSAAEVKWVKFVETNVTKCGIPTQVVSQLKEVHGHTEQTKEKICAAGPTAAPPSLADALGTTKLPTPETTRNGSGTLDTLTGNAIQR